MCKHCCYGLVLKVVAEARAAPFSAVFDQLRRPAQPAGSDTQEVQREARKAPCNFIGITRHCWQKKEERKKRAFFYFFTFFLRFVFFMGARLSCRYAHSGQNGGES